MKNNSEIALELFKNGYNCAQSVLASVSEKLKIDKDTALNLSIGFGAGMGRLQQTCGAVTGAFMAIGMFSQDKFDNNKQKKDFSYKLVQQFAEKFTKIHKTTNCKELINCDLNTIEGQKFATENKVFEKICEKCVFDAVLILDEILNEN